MNLSVSAVSQQIAALEQDFGVALFIRGNRGSRLSPAGEVLKKYAERIEGHWGQAFREVRMVASGQLTIHMAASHTVSEVFLPEPLGRFRRQHQDVQVRLTLANSVGVASLVETGQVDFGLAEGPVGRRPLSVSPLWQDELGLVMSLDHRLAEAPVVRVTDLLGADLILREEGSGTRTVLEEALKRAGVHLDPGRIMMESSSLRAILAMIRHNVGVSVLSRAVTDDAQGVHFALIEGLSLKRDIVLLSRSTDDLTEPARALVDALGAPRRARPRQRGGVAARRT